MSRSLKRDRGGMHETAAVLPKRRCPPAADTRKRRMLESSLHSLPPIPKRRCNNNHRFLIPGKNTYTASEVCVLLDHIESYYATQVHVTQTYDYIS
jgi:hypothetical protein